MLKYRLALVGCLVCTPALADQFNTTQGGGPSNGAVVQRRQGTTGNVGVPVDETNPLPVTGGGTAGSVGTAGTNGTTAQSVQGITGGVPVPVSNASLPLPTGAATAANQTASLPAGTNLIGKTGIDQTTPGTTNAVATSPGTRTLVALDVATVTTGGTAVTALTATHKSAGGWIQNPPSATINLCLNEIGTASGTTSAGNTTCITPGQTYNLTPTAGAVSVISSDSAHPFSGMGLN